MIKIKFFCCLDENFNKTRKWKLENEVNIAHPDHIQNAIDGEFATHSKEGWKYEVELTEPMAATLCCRNDTYPYTVHKISKNGKSVFASPDDYRWNETLKDYEYTNRYMDQPDHWSEFNVRKNRRWTAKGDSLNGTPLSFGYRRFYNNPEI